MSACDIQNARGAGSYAIGRWKGADSPDAHYIEGVAAGTTGIGHGNIIAGNTPGSELVDIGRRVANPGNVQIQ